MRRGLPGMTPLDLAASDSESYRRPNNTSLFDCEAVTGAHVLFKHGSPICLRKNDSVNSEKRLQLEVFGWQLD